MQLICQLIKQQREFKKISLEKLSSGLCHFTYLANDIEKKGNIADKFLLDSLLQRLGISDDYFEHFVSVEDINIQNIRTQIFKSVKLKNCDQIEGLITQYQTFKLDNIHQQFIEYIKAKALQLQSKSIDIVTQQYLKAINFTLLEFESRNIEDFLLSSVEACIVFDYSILVEQVDLDKGLELYLQLYRYFNKSDIEIGVKCRVLPKLIYNICKIWLKECKYAEILDLCDVGIECLRQNDKMYYFTKLLEIKIQVIEISKLNENEYDKIKKWYDILLEFYHDYDLNPNDDYVIYLENFIWRNYNAIGDVIKKRRKMFGLSQIELSNEICDVKTLSRIENGQVKPHVIKTELILKRLNLSGQFYSDNIIFKNYETFALARETTSELIKNNYLLAKEKLLELSPLLDLDDKINLQYIKQKQVLLKHFLNKSTVQEKLDSLLEVLQITIPYEVLFDKKAKYLTKKELILINNIITCYDNLGQIAEKNRLIDVLKYYFTDNDKKTIYFSAYTFSYLNVSSICGNSNDFQKSNLILYNLLKENSDNNYFNEILNIVYDLLWNIYTETGKDISEEKLLEIAYVLIDIKRQNYISYLLQKSLDL